jgi:antitoxin (DNA-binding transcriptional repressor) of toxin-antitoxin stability system
MKTIEIKETDALWAEYAQTQELIVLTREGQPVAALVPIEGMDLETMSLSTNQKFWEIIERSRQSQKEGGRIFLEEARQQLDFSD